MTNIEWSTDSPFQYDETRTSLQNWERVRTALAERDATIAAALNAANGEGNNSMFISVSQRRRMIEILSAAPGGAPTILTKANSEKTTQ